MGRAHCAIRIASATTRLSGNQYADVNDRPPHRSRSSQKDFLSNGNFGLCYRSSSSGDLACAVKVSNRINTPTGTAEEKSTGFGTISEH